MLKGYIIGGVLIIAINILIGLQLPKLEPLQLFLWIGYCVVRGSAVSAAGMIIGDKLTAQKRK